MGPVIRAVIKWRRYGIHTPTYWWNTPPPIKALPQSIKHDSLHTSSWKHPWSLTASQLISLFVGKRSSVSKISILTEVHMFPALNLQCNTVLLTSGWASITACEALEECFHYKPVTKTPYLCWWLPEEFILPSLLFLSHMFPIVCARVDNVMAASMRHKMTFLKTNKQKKQQELWRDSLLEGSNLWSESLHICSHSCKHRVGTETGLGQPLSAAGHKLRTSRNITEKKNQTLSFPNALLATISCNATQIMQATSNFQHFPDATSSFSG